MGRAPCCDKANVKKGPWSPEEDALLKAYIEKHGTGGNWIALPQKIGLKRCGKSCRLRWLNYLRPNIKHGGFSEEEDNLICNLYVSIGSRWSIIAAQLPGRTDNDIKNYWNTRLKKKLLSKQRKELQEARLKQEMMMMKRQNQFADHNNLNGFGETYMNQQQTLYWPQLPQAVIMSQPPEPTYNYYQTPSSPSPSDHHHHQDQKPIIENMVIKTEQGETTKTTTQEITNNVSCQNPFDFSFSQDQNNGGFTMNSVMSSSTSSPLPSNHYNVVSSGTNDQQELLQWLGIFPAEAINELLTNNIPNLDGLENNNTFYGNSTIGATSTSADQSTISWEDSLVYPSSHHNQIVSEQGKFSLEDASYFNVTINQV